MKISLIAFRPRLTGKWFIRDVRLDLCQPQHFNLQDDSWGSYIWASLCCCRPARFHLAHVTLTHLPTSEEWICLYYHILNGSIMKGLLAIRQEGVGPGADRTTDGFARPPGNVNVRWEFRVCAELISISPFIFFFFLSRLYYCGCSCHGSRWFFSCMDGCLWGMRWFRHNWPLCIHHWHIDWQYSRVFL